MLGFIQFFLLSIPLAPGTHKISEYFVIVMSPKIVWMMGGFGAFPDGYCLFSLKEVKYIVYTLIGLHSVISSMIQIILLIASMRANYNFI